MAIAGCSDDGEPIIRPDAAPSVPERPSEQPLRAGDEIASAPIVLGHFTHFHSDLLNEDRPLMIYLPRDHGEPDSRYPVLYLLDARYNFHNAAATVRTLSRTGHLPEMIVVGIANTNRIRDLTPSKIAGGTATARLATGGGAAEFLGFLETELIPHIDQSYRTAPFKVLAGHSLSGLFGLYALMHKPDLFNGFIILGPSMEFGDYSLLKELRQRSLARTQYRTFLFIGMAIDDYMFSPRQTRGLLDLLRHEGLTGLEWRLETFLGQDHRTLGLRGMDEGLRAVFPNWKVPVLSEDSATAYADHYARLSSQYGYAIRPGEGLINDWGYAALDEGRIDEAIDLFELNRTNYPDSANVYDSLAEALEMSGEFDAAERNYELAYEKAKAQDSPDVEMYKRHLDTVRGRRSHAAHGED